jgi:hypothetical protein
MKNTMKFQKIGLDEVVHQNHSIFDAKVLIMIVFLLGSLVVMISIRLAIIIQRNNEIQPKKDNLKEYNLEKERGFDGVRISDEATRLLL